MKPNYKLIYSDIIKKKIPHKKDEYSIFLEKKELSFLDVINLNEKIFGSENSLVKFNKKFRSYSKTDILHILRHQKENNLNNIQLSQHFGLSRNTIAKWKKLFMV